MIKPIRKMTPAEEVYTDNRIKRIKSWLDKCPKECVIADLYEIICLLWDDRQVMQHHKDIEENQFY